GVSACPGERAGERPREAEAVRANLRNGLGPRRAPALRGQGEDPAGRREKSPLGALFQSHRRVRAAIARRQRRLHRVGGGIEIQTEVGQTVEAWLRSNRAYRR